MILHNVDVRLSSFCATEVPVTFAREHCVEGDNSRCILEVFRREGHEDAAQ
jgi:hypothetical protein